jgi:hypothetical protein
MWRQLSGFEKFRFVACVVGLPAAVFAATVSAMDHRWFNAALQALLGVSFVYYLYKSATRERGSATPSQSSSNPAVVIGTIVALIALGVGGVFGYQHFFVKHGPPPITMNAEDNSFTVSVPPAWQTANVPHAKAFVLLLARAHGGSMVVLESPAKSTLQEDGKSAVDEMVKQTKVVVDPGGDLQPTTVDGEAALRFSSTLAQPTGAAPAGAHGQNYVVQHRTVEYQIFFVGEPDDYAIDHAEFDAIMNSWKWSASQPSAAVTPAEAALERLLLSPDQIDTAMNTTGITVDHFTTTMSDVSALVSDQACRPLSGGLIAQAYAGSGWTAFREQVLKAPADSQVRSVDQGVVSFPSAHDAEAFFTASAQQWPACANRQYTETPAGQPDEVWSVGPVSNTDGTLSYTNTVEGRDGVACQRALSVTANIAIDVNTCGGAPSGAAVDIAHQIAAKVPTQ